MIVQCNLEANNGLESCNEVTGFSFSINLKGKVQWFKDFLKGAKAVKLRYRIVKLRNGLYAKQRKVWIMPWKMRRPSPYSVGYQQWMFSTVEGAEHSGEQPDDIIEVVKEI